MKATTAFPLHLSLPSDVEAKAACRIGDPPVREGDSPAACRAAGGFANLRSPNGAAEHSPGQTSLGECRPGSPTGDGVREALTLPGAVGNRRAAPAHGLRVGDDLPAEPRVSAGPCLALGSPALAMGETQGGARSSLSLGYAMPPRWGFGKRDGEAASTDESALAFFSELT